MYRKLILLIIVIVIICFESITIKTTSINDNDYINVEVRGEITEEKIIKLPLGSTFDDLLSYIELSNDADISIFSKTQVLSNNQIIDIPKFKSYDLISINNASIDSLSSLPGIGKSIALKICEYREAFGCFNSLEEIMNVSGIGIKKFEKIKKYITL